VLLIALAIVVAKRDQRGRHDVAAWYDHNGSINREVLARIAAKAPTIKPSDTVCVIGAAIFSPWYMHGGAYLRNVMGLKNKWRLYVPKGAPELAGFQVGADMSGGTITIESQRPLPPEGSVVVDLRGIQAER